MKKALTVEAKAAQAHRRARQALERLERARVRVAEVEKMKARTRHYRLGLVLESFLFEDPSLRWSIEELIQLESPRVRATFALDQPPSWFDQPQRDDPSKVVDTRRFRLGMALEKLLPGDHALVGRVEGLMREQSAHVRAAFRMDGDGPSWFAQRLSAPR